MRQQHADEPPARGEAMVGGEAKVHVVEEIRTGHERHAQGNNDPDHVSQRDACSDVQQTMTLGEATIKGTIPQPLFNILQGQGGSSSQGQGEENG